MPFTFEVIKGVAKISKIQNCYKSCSKKMQPGKIATKSVAKYLARVNLLQSKIVVASVLLT